MKTILNRKIISTICKVVEDGATYRVAATSVGVDRRTLYIWRKKGAEEASGIYRELFEKLQRAEGKFIADQLSIISRAGRASWQACAWLLERRHPDLFGRSDRYQANLLRELQNELREIKAELNKPAFKIA